MLPFFVKKRIKRIALAGAFLFALVIFKLAWLQIGNRDVLLKKAQDLWERDFIVSGLRGNILDSNGNVLATDLASTSVMAVPSLIEEKEKTAEFLAEILNADYSTLLSKLSASVSTQRLKEGKLISNQQALAITKENLKGIYLVQDSLRYYPSGAYLAQVLGFTGIDNQGLVGLEYQYEELLKAKSGSMKIPFDAKGHPIKAYSERYVAPGQGLDVMLTIDKTIQDILERECNNAVKKYNPDAAWAIAMNPSTGEILAMVSKPDFDPNNYSDYDSSTYNHNLPIWKSYEPGSTFKTITFAAALEENLFDMEKDTYVDIGYEIVEGAKLKSWKAGGHGTQTYMECLQNSSNPCFVHIAELLGKDKLNEYLDLFNIGAKTNVDLPGENAGLRFSDESFGLLEQATTGFGQGISVTAIQLAAAFSAIVNGGKYYQPYITKAVIHPSSKDVLFEVEPHLVKQVISEETSFKMRVALESVVAKGGAKGSYIEGYRIGGKTGTAQKAVDGKYLSGEYILSYICAAPIDDPQIVIYMALDAPKSNIQYGGTVVSPIVKNALEDILVYLNVKKTDKQMAKTKLWSDPVTVEVPDFIGEKKKEVKHSDLQFVFYGKGDIVVDQLPSANEKIDRYGTVWIYLNEEKSKDATKNSGDTVE